ncbi:MAG: MarR family transcriptional regulator [Clostridium sp.]|nr:MarR family transcriptional regulator [Acetatifactor muris]MCM1527914.1 MarR family transcriptional regulator [Bacteroides sp.]MCM1564020.1 MarR family transcriptional regulator [Clostridium sp.]
MDDSCEYSRRLLISLNQIDELYYMFGKSSGVKENTLILLWALDDGRPRTQKQICDEWFLPKTTINTAVKECANAGYITYIPGKNGREKLLILTDKGKKYSEAVMAPIGDIEEAAMMRTLKQCSPEFIRGMELYAQFLKEEGQKLLMQKD